jgi:hypothetical protein
MGVPVACRNAQGRGDPREAVDAKGRAAARSFERLVPGSKTRDEDDARGRGSMGEVGDSRGCAGPIE